jgi:hypothetical protein
MVLLVLSYVLRHKKLMGNMEIIKILKENHASS